MAAFPHPSVKCPNLGTLPSSPLHCQLSTVTRILTGSEAFTEVPFVILEPNTLQNRAQIVICFFFFFLEAVMERSEDSIM